MHRPMKLIVAQQRQWQKRNFYSFSFFDYILQLNFPEHIFELKKLDFRRLYFGKPFTSSNLMFFDSIIL